MAYCVKCGTKLNKGSSFCHSCGTPVKNSEETGGGKTRSQAFSGTIYKCPNCGNPVEAFSASCPLCGYEFRNTKSSNAILEFQGKYERTRSLEEKINLIRLFAIPNNREDIIEFIILSRSNVDYNNYFDDKAGKLTDAWIAKLNQALDKAKIILPDDDPFRDRISEICDQLSDQRKEFDRLVKEVGDAQKRELKYQERQHKRELKYAERQANKEERESFKAMLLLLGIAIALIASSYAMLVFPEKKIEKNLEKIVDQVEELIEEGEYEEALRKADKIVYDGDGKDSKKKWDKVRDSMIQRIGEAEAKSMGKVRIPTTDFDGEQYDKVVNAFKVAGFTNVNAQKKTDLITGWINHEGEVFEVLIDGSKKYNGGDYVEEDVEVVIRYHAFK